MASLSGFFKNDKNTFSTLKGKLKEIDSTQPEFVHLAVKYFEVLQALESGDSNNNLMERLQAIESKSTSKVGEIVADAVERRVSFLEGQIKKTMEAKEQILNDSNIDADNKIKSFGSANLRLREYVNKMMAYNKQASQDNRVYISASTTKKKINSDLTGIRTHAKALGDFFAENEREIICHNVEMGVFEQSIKYVNKTYKAHALRIARDCGYEG